MDKFNHLTGVAAPLRMDNIDTDRIIPARFLRCVTFEGLGDHAFEDDRKAHPGGAHPFDRQEFQGARILVVNRNFGCGSSREHAPQSLSRWGIQAVVGESFAEIFFGNCIALGVPCLTLSSQDVARLQDAIEKDPSLQIVLDLEARTVIYREPSIYPEPSEGSERSVAAGLPDGAQQAFLAGTWDAAGLLMESPETIDRVAASLPYVSGWTR